MKKITIGLLSAFLSLSTLQVSAQVVPPAPKTNYATINWCDSYSDSVRQAQAKSKPLLILFTGTAWCPACIKLEREVLNRSDFANAVGDKLVFYKAEFNDPSPEALESTPDKVLLDRYNVSAFPTMVVVDHTGRQLFTVPYTGGKANDYVNDINQKLQSYQSTQTSKQNTSNVQSTQSSQTYQSNQGYQNYQSNRANQNNQGYQNYQGNRYNQGYSSYPSNQGYQNYQNYQGNRPYQSNQYNQGYPSNQGYQNYQGNGYNQGYYPSNSNSQSYYR
jgi:thioredoxin-related protein